jgi:glycosyltransferase involved in cell wall biosynthesis
MGGNLSGVEIYILNLLKELFKIDKKNSYILFANASSDQSRHLPHFNCRNVKVIQTRIPNKILNLCLFLFNRPRIDRLIKSQGQFDLCFQPDLRPVSLSKGIKRVNVVHDLSFHHFPQFFSLKTRLWHRLLQPRKILKKSDAIIAVSDFTKTDLVNTYNIPAEKVTVIHEGINDRFCTNLTKKKLDEVKLKYNLPDKYFLFLATIEPRKNSVRLIDAFKIFKQKHENNLKLVMAGKTNQKIFSSLKLKKDPDIVFTGFIDENDKEAVYKLASALIYPSLYEGFGLPLLEAMKCGTPIITSNLSSMPEIVKNAAICIDPYKTDEIAEAMNNVMNPSAIHQLKQNMSHQINQYSWQKCAQKTLELFKSLISL